MILSMILISASALKYDTHFINSQQDSWTVLKIYNQSTNYDRWSAYDKLSIKRVLGALLDDPNEGPFSDAVIVNVPDSFDSRVKWPSCRTSVRDQSFCGSCWAVSAASVLSDRYCIQKGINIELSAEDLLQCCGINCGNGCDGGYASGAWKFFQNKGVVSGNEYENRRLCKAYSFPPCDHSVKGTYGPCKSEIFLKMPLTLSCQLTCHTESSLDYQQDKRYIKSYAQVAANEEAIKSEIYTNGPVQAVFKVYEDFLTYKSGVYEYSYGDLLGGHAVKIIGWGTEAGKPYWLCVNSWNTEWGLGGLFKIRRGIDHLGIESQVWMGMV